jgi:hypothetical protein
MVDHRGASAKCDHMNGAKCDALLMNGRAAQKLLAPRPSPTTCTQKDTQSEVQSIRRDVPRVLRAVVEHHISCVAQSPGVNERDICAYSTHLGQALADLWSMFQSQVKSES